MRRQSAGRALGYGPATVVRTVAVVVVLVACASRRLPGPESNAGSLASVRTTATPAERSGYSRTTPYDSVVAYLRTLAGGAAGTSSRFALGTAGTSTEGRALPYVVLARPMVRTSAEAHGSGRPVVYIEANIHGGEIEGKEAVLALVRDLAVTADPAAPSVLDSVVIVVVPIYNADGNDHFGPQATNRSEQNGPAIVGERTNGQHLDLNRDFIKAEAPETRMTFALFRTWDPDVFVDLHTTDGSFHGYALTYAPSLSPAAVVTGPYTRDVLLPVLRRRMRERHHFEAFDYGNFEPERSPGRDTIAHVWRTYDNRPRFGTNYVGLRNRIGILSEAYSHDPMDRRVASTYAFVREILSLVAERRAEILRIAARGDSAVADWSGHPGRAPAVALAATFAPSTRRERVLAERLERVSGPGGDTVLTQPGVQRGTRRSGQVEAVEMPVVDRFAPAVADRLPAAYVVPARDTAVLRLLDLHGVRTRRLGGDSAVAGLERFIVDSVRHSPREFQGHYEASVTGRWTSVPADTVITAGSYLVPCGQPLGIVAAYLLDPRSDDGLVTWNLFDRELMPGQPFPVGRIVGRAP